MVSPAPIKIMKNFTQILTRAALLAIGFGMTFMAIQSVTQTSLEHKGSSGPELYEGDVVDLPALPRLTGGMVDLKSLNQQYLICAVFSVSCPGCSMDSEFWADLKNACDEKNIAFNLISVDSDQARVEKFARAYGVETLPILHEQDDRAKTAFKLSIVPQYLLLSSGGKVIARWDGVGHTKTGEERARRINDFFKRLPEQ